MVAVAELRSWERELLQLNEQQQQWLPSIVDPRRNVARAPVGDDEQRPLEQSGADEDANDEAYGVPAAEGAGSPTSDDAAEAAKALPAETAET